MRVLLEFTTPHAAFFAGYNDYILDPSDPVRAAYARQRLAADDADRYLRGQRNARRESSKTAERELYRLLRAKGLSRPAALDEVAARRAARVREARHEFETRNSRLRELHPSGSRPLPVKRSLAFDASSARPSNGP